MKSSRKPGQPEYSPRRRKQRPPENLGGLRARGLSLSSDPRYLLLYQAVLNLIPVAFISLPRHDPEQATGAIEVHPEEVVEG